MKEANMIKSNLPVILLKNLVLLPYQEIRVEIKSELSKKVTEISKLYHDINIQTVEVLKRVQDDKKHVMLNLFLIKISFCRIIRIIY